MSMQRDDSSAFQGAAPSSPSAGSVEALWHLLGRPLAFHRRLAELAGSAKSGLLLGQMLYWTRHGRDIEPNAGWFHKTAQQWTRETGLSRREQCSARRKLMQLGLMEERRAGIPATLHFRLHLDRIALGLGALIGQPAGAIDWQNPGQVADWLGASSTYYPRLTEITGSVNSALVLSRALVLTKHLHADATGWIGKSAAAWTRELGLTFAEYQHARRCLSVLGLWSAVLRGIPAQTCVRVESEVLMRRLECNGHPSDSSPDIGRSPETPSQNVQPSMQESAQPDWPKSPDWFRPFAHASAAQTPKLNRALTTRCGLQTPPPSSEGGTPTACGVEKLVFPPGLNAQEHRAAAAMLAAVPAIAQALLDELAARMAMNTVRTSPTGYLRALVARAAAGQFVADAGVQVRALRRQRANDEEQQRIRRREAEEARARRESPQYQATLERRREDMRRFLAQSRRSTRSDAPMSTSEVAHGFQYSETVSAVDGLAATSENAIASGLTPNRPTRAADDNHLSATAEPNGVTDRIKGSRDE